VGVAKALQRLVSECEEEKEDYWRREKRCMEALMKN